MTRSILAALALVLTASLGAGCFTVDIPDGGLGCSQDGKQSCPEGYVCVDGRCLQRPDLAHSSLDGGVPIRK